MEWSWHGFGLSDGSGFGVSGLGVTAQDLGLGV